VPLLPDAEPFNHDGNKIGVLVSHGFTGQPKSIKPWAQHLADQGYTVRAPRLPGHGTTWQEMNGTVWQDWYAEIERNYRELAKTCDKVFVMGLSMGGSLALRLAEEKGDSIAGLVLVNPAVQSERLDRHLLPVLRLIVPAFPGIINDIKKPGQDEGGYPKIPLKAAYSLTHLWSAIKADITKVDQPLLIFRSADDHVVEPSNTAWIMANVASKDAEEVVLHDSYHVATMDNEAQDIFDGSSEFVKRILAEGK
jgi:carboxylesterase